jgi:hypothetical protein
MASSSDNGGPVPARYPAPGSVLVNQIPSSACPIAVDACGVTRPQGPACDIGAVGGASLRAVLACFFFPVACETEKQTTSRSRNHRSMARADVRPQSK